MSEHYLGRYWNSLENVLSTACLTPIKCCKDIIFHVIPSKTTVRQVGLADK